MIIAKKPCRFEGEDFFIGDVIPDKYVLDPEAMEKMGIISIVNKGTSADIGDVVAQVADVFFKIPIIKEKKMLEIDVSEAQMIETVKIMQMSVKEATAHIKDCVEDNTVLILLNALDSRTSIKKETEEKALTISKMEESVGDT